MQNNKENMKYHYFIKTETKIEEINEAEQNPYKDSRRGISAVQLLDENDTLQVVNVKFNDCILIIKR